MEQSRPPCANYCSFQTKRNSRPQQDPNLDRLVRGQASLEPII